MTVLLQQRRPLGSTRAHLDHLCLESRSPRNLADFYAVNLGYAITAIDDYTFSGVAAGRRLLFTRGEDRKLAYAVFAMESAVELERLRLGLDASGIRTEPFSNPFAKAGAFGVRSPDGDLFVFGETSPVEPISTPGSVVPPARLQHIVMASTNAARVASFFSDVLGFTLSDTVVDDVGGVRTAFLRSSDEHHSFAVFQAPENRLDHHCYETSDWSSIRDWADQFARERVIVQWGPGRHGPGNNLFLFVHDVDGNWVEISAELEVVDHDRSAGIWPHEERTANYWGKGLLRS